ncbi:MAG: hypothetical protein ACQERZ_09185 [Fusobacteriota bacterium]
MKYLKLVIFSLFILSITSFSRTIGLGGEIGTISGVNLSIPQKDNMYNFLLAYDFKNDNKLILAGDYLIENKRIDSLKDLPFWYGGQIKINFEEDTALSIQAKGELVYSLSEFKHLEIFTSISPGLQIIPETKADFDLNLGARYFFDLK